MKREGLKLIAEPINYFDIPGFFLNHSAQTLEIIAETGSTNLNLQYDIYHMQRMEGELAATIERLLPRIGHIQIAGNPGRNEPDIGEINYPYLMKRLDDLGYGGWVGAEYKPKGRTEDGLGWLRAWGG
jgi:hydroxypyruvate isomerase